MKYECSDFSKVEECYAASQTLPYHVMFSKKQNLRFLCNQYNYKSINVELNYSSFSGRFHTGVCAGADEPIQYNSSSGVSASAVGVTICIPVRDCTYICILPILRLWILLICWRSKVLRSKRVASGPRFTSWPPLALAWFINCTRTRNGEVQKPTHFTIQ